MMTFDFEPQGHIINSNKLRYKDIMRGKACYGVLRVTVLITIFFSSFQFICFQI